MREQIPTRDNAYGLLSHLKDRYEVDWHMAKLCDGYYGETWDIATTHHRDLVKGDYIAQLEVYVGTEKKIVYDGYVYRHQARAWESFIVQNVEDLCKVLDKYFKQTSREPEQLSLW